MMLSRVIYDIPTNSSSGNGGGNNSLKWFKFILINWRRRNNDIHDVVN
jgi:hypothetical protein